ncbi:MAG: nucleotide sugar dehydrogenase [Telmatospirillum sp.]|nr:nucleotide sugar dehydrogenase [Telmatospirillum sp.]
MTAARATIGFLGMSHLGICSLAAAAERGFRVFGYDPDAGRIAELKRGLPPVSEPGLQESLAKQRERMTFSASADGLRACDIVYLSFDVPTNDQGQSDLAPIRELAGRAIAVLRDDAVLVVLCQVPPGFTRGLPIPGARLFYQVETLVFGQAVQRALCPERIIVGCDRKDRPLDARYSAFLESFDCPILQMRYESAELAKISINMCLIASVSVANVMAEICEKIGADWREIVPALKLDRRIGAYSYLAAGMGISGGNLERDLATVRGLGEANGTDVGVVKAWQYNSEHRKNWAWRVVAEKVLSRNPAAAIAMWGLAYKENTHSMKNAPSVALLAKLSGATVAAYDPAVPHDALAANVVRTHTPLDAATGADALCIMTPWPEFAAIEPGAIAAKMRGRVVLDPYGMLDARAACDAGLECFTLGAATIHEANS